MISEGNGAKLEEGRLRPGQLPRPDLGHRQGRSTTASTARQPLSILTLGAGQVIQGWDQGLDGPEGRQPCRAGHPAGPRLRRAGPPQASIKPQRHAGLRRGHPEGDLQRQELRQGQGGRAGQHRPAEGRHATPTARPPPSTIPKKPTRRRSSSRTTSSRATARWSRPTDSVARAVQGRAVGGRQEVRLAPTRGQDADPFPLPAGRQGLEAGPDRQEGRQPRPARHPAGPGLRRQGRSSGIPKNSTLVFTVDILRRCNDVCCESVRLPIM